MQWEELSGQDLAQAAKDTGLCIVPVASMEYHGPHLPLATDALNAHAVAVAAAREEPAVVFPHYYFGQLNCSRHFPGSIAIDPDLHSRLLWALCDEIGRNGFRKIVLHNGHGGNTNWLKYVAQCALYERKPYSLYVTNWLADSSLHRQVHDICPSPGGHGDDVETSMTLAVAPHLVKMDRVPAQPELPRNRLKHLGETYAGIWWYAHYPEHYAGDARAATAEKGRKLLELYTQALVKVIRAIKADETVPALEKEFFDRVGGVGR
jgi:creatinine amidohydrolase